MAFPSEIHVSRAEVRPRRSRYIAVTLGATFVLLACLALSVSRTHTDTDESDLGPPTSEMMHVLEEAHVPSASHLPRGSLSELEKRLSVAEVSYQTLQSKLNAAKAAASLALDSVVADGKQVSASMKKAKDDKSTEQELKDEDSEERRRGAELLSKAAADEDQAKKVSEKVKSSELTADEREKNLDEVEKPIQEEINEAENLKQKQIKDEMKLAGLETKLTSLPAHSKKKSKMKKRVMALLSKAEEETKKIDSLESDSRAKEAKASNIPVVDKSTIEGEMFMDKAAVYTLDTHAHLLKLKGEADEKEAEENSGKEKALLSDAATYQKLAQNQQTQLVNEIKSEKSARAKSLLLETQLKTAERDLNLLKIAISDKSTQAPEATEPAHTIPNDAVDRAAAFAKPEGGDGPLALADKDEKLKMEKDEKENQTLKAAEEKIKSQESKMLDGHLENKSDLHRKPDVFPHLHSDD